MMLNIVLLVTCICIVIVLLTYLFFWNRVVGYLFGLVFRLFYWSQGESSVWLDIGSVHFSVLSGRISFKDLRYHSSNQTIRVVKGQLSWRYWIRRPAEEEDLAHARVVGDDMNPKGKHPLACRVHMSMQGFEWFIYNRSAAYDNIVAQMETDNMPSTPAPTPARASFDERRPFRRASTRTSAPNESIHPLSLISSIYKRTPSFFKRLTAWIRPQLPHLDPKNLLPVSLEATKGAIICGNPSTPNLLIADFSRAEGTYGIVQARSKHDLYKQLLNLKFHNATVHYVENSDYRTGMTDIGQKVYEHIQDTRGPPLRQSSYLSFSSFEQLWSSLKLWSVTTMSQPRTHGFFAYIAVLMPHPPTTWPWRKKKEDVDEETPLGADFSTLEYAIERKVLEAGALELLYYADVVGTVPVEVSQQSHSDSGGLDPFDIGNGDLPPEWGLDFVVRQGFVRYGPWADRQRVELQRTFFPPMFHDVDAAPRLKPGDMRMWTGLKVFIELRDGVTLQIPFREASKNWQWDGKVEVPNRPRKREPAWVHVKAGDSSTISYILPMVAGPKGYQSILEVHLDTVTVTSSLNDIRLVTAESCRVQCDLPTPLKWNGERQWSFAVSLRQTSLFLLRDHVNMLTDLGKDWSAGPPGDYNRFIPMVYAVTVDLSNYEINLYVNDHNIIDKPLIREDNAMLTIRGTHFRNGVQIPFLKFRPALTTLAFWIEAPEVGVSLTLPRWNTYTIFATPDRSDLGTIGLLRLDGTYLYYTEVREEYVDHLKLDFGAHDVIYKAFGWTIRHFMILRDNYFGSFTHFSTLYEYLEKKRRKQFIGDPIDLQYRQGNSNSLEVELALNIEQGLMVMPAGFPGYEMYDPDQKEDDLGTCLVLNLPGLQVQLRTNDYFMEMSFNVDTMSGRVQEHCTKRSLLAPKNTKEPFVIDGIDITANRLFGPQPYTSTYVCIWEIHLGDVKAALSAYEGRLLSAALSAFGINFSDPLNAPAKEYALPLDPDVTFLNVTVDSINLVWLVDSVAVEISLLHGLRISSNDLAGKLYRKVTSIRLPNATVKALLASKNHPDTWYEASNLVGDANVDIYSTPIGWEESARAQTEFIATQDKQTGRARFCYAPDYVERTGSSSGRTLHDNDLYLPPIRVTGPAGVRRSRTMSGRRLSGQLQTPRLSPHATVPSESEADEFVSDADRDARLMNSRPMPSLNGLWQTDDDESLLSGDESDDEDLTESQEWDSDESDSPTNEPWPALAQYGVLTKHYSARSLARPSLWNGSPFKLSRNAIPCHRPDSHVLSGGDGSKVKNHEADWALPEQCSEQETERSIFRGLCRRGLHIWLSPLLLPVVEGLLKDVNSNQLSPELRFDAMMARYLQAPAENVAYSKEILFDVHLSSVQLLSTQFVDPSNLEDLDNGLKATLRPQDGPITQVTLCLDDWHSRGSLLDRHTGAPSQPVITSSVGSLALSFKSEEDMVAADKNPPSPIACRITLSQIYTSTVGQDLTASLDDVVANFSHAAPEVILATASAIVRCTQGLLASQRHSSVHTPALDQQIIHQVLKYSRQRPVVDPLSTIQPSYLVQTGHPDKLRRNTSFKFLVYLRVCLRYLDVPERRTVVELQPDLEARVSLHDIISTLESQYFGHAGDDDTASLSQQSILHELFPVSDDSPTRGNLQTPGSSALTISLRLQRMSVSVHHKDDVVRSNFSLSSLVILAHVRSTGFLHHSVLNLNKGLATLSLRDKDRLDIRHVAVSISLGQMTTTIVPQLMRFVQIAIRTNRRYSPSLIFVPQSTPGTSIVPRRSSEKPPPILYLDFVLSTRFLRFLAAAEKLTAEFTMADITYATTILIKPQSAGLGPSSFSMNHSLSFDESVIRACSGSDMPRPQDSGTLASFRFKNCRANVIVLQEPRKDVTYRIVLGIRTLGFTVPRSALRLYRFMDEWRADYLPGLDAAIQALLSELHQQPTKPASVSSETSQRSASSHPNIQVQVSISSIQIKLQVMLGTWLSWNMNRTLVHITSSNVRAKHVLSFGLEVGPHAVSVSSKAQTAEDITSNVRINIDLPTTTLKGQHDDTGVHGLALVKFFHLTLKPSDLDTLLSIQQKSGQDFNDFLLLLEESRRNRTTSSSGSRSKSTSSHKLTGSFRMEGFRIGLEGLTSALLLECDDIGGGYESFPTPSWHVKLSDLALSLATSNIRTALDRGHRSAFVTIDFQANMGRQLVSNGELLQVSVTKVHAVMHPSSIGELGDFIDHLQAEVLIREEERSTELAAFKEKTKSLLRSLDVKVGEPQDAEFSWLDKYSLKMTIRNVGVAFPLALGRDLQMPRSGSQDDATVSAFLFSIRSISFGTNHGESGQATMKGFSFQFVPRFRQSVADDFSGDSHQTRNRLVYPEMTAQLRSERSAGSRRVLIRADVSGFILDVDASMTDYIFSLIDVYRQGKDRMERLASNVPRPSPSPVVSRVRANSAKQYEALPTSNIFLNLTFSSGKVVMHCRESDPSASRMRSFPVAHDRSMEFFSEAGVEVFELPMVSVWGEYRATSAATKIAGSRDQELSTLMFKSTIHSSQNTLKPTLLPFVTAIVDRVEDRMRSITRKTPHPSPLRPHELLSSLNKEGVAEYVLEPTSGMQISLSLRIDQSKLELTCQPDVNVIAGLHWDSGGFVINIAPGARRVAFTGNVGGLTVGLKHGFLSEDCVRLDARNLAFNLTFAKMELEAGKVTSSISIAIDTEFAGSARFSRFQDVLCFKAVWLDRIPVLSGHHSPVPQDTPDSLSPTPRTPSSPKQELTTAVLLRLRRIQLDADLGQSISIVKLNLTDVLFRTRLSEALSELSFSIAKLAIVASGNVSGKAAVPDFQFQTMRRNDGKAANATGGRMLDLSMTSGPLNAELESEYQKLIQYRAEPVEVLIYDDWSKISNEVAVDKRRVNVTSSVSGTEVVVIMNVGTIPRLVSYANKFKANLEAQKDGASRESKAFRIASSPKPDNPLSAVANAMLKSTRSRMREAEAGISYTIGQRLSLKLARLRLVVFPRSMRDTELAQFIGTDVHARLDRLVFSNDIPARRDLHLSFASISTSRITQLNHTLVTRDKIVESQQWLSTLIKDAPEATIFGLPSMDIRMQSEELLRETTKALAYDFSSKFGTVRQGGRDTEDIYITLNMALYSWLTTLRKSFAREMEQVQAAADVRAGAIAVSQQPGGLQRKKSPEALALPADTRPPSPDLLDPLQPRSPRSIASPHLFKPISSPSESLAPPGGRVRSSTIIAPPAKSPVSPRSSTRLPSPPRIDILADTTVNSVPPPSRALGITYEPRERAIERLTMRQLGEATPDVMHPFFMKKAGFSLEDSLPQYVHEYATMPAEEIMKALLKLYSKQLSVDEATNPKL